MGGDQSGAIEIIRELGEGSGNPIAWTCREDKCPGVAASSAEHP
jgi:hypothetical protein